MFPFFQFFTFRVNLVAENQLSMMFNGRELVDNDLEPPLRVLVAHDQVIMRVLEDRLENVRARRRMHR